MQNIREKGGTTVLSWPSKQNRSSKRSYLTGIHPELQRCKLSPFIINIFNCKASGSQGLVLENPFLLSARIASSYLMPLSFFFSAPYSPQKRTVLPSSPSPKSWPFQEKKKLSVLKKPAGICLKKGAGPETPSLESIPPVRQAPPERTWLVSCPPP